MKKVFASVCVFCALSLVPIAVFASGEKGNFRVLIQFTDGTSLVRTCLSDMDFGNIIRIYASRPDVLFVERESYYAQTLAPNDPLFASQENLQVIDAESAWDVTTGAQEVVVAVLDSGVDIDHPDLASNIWQNGDEVSGNAQDDDQNGYIDDVSGWDFILNSNNPRPSFSGSSASAHHGTLIAGIIGAEGNNKKGVAGIAWGIRIMPLRVLSATGSGSSIDVSEAIRYAANNGADIINLSIIGSTFSRSLSEAIQFARSKGVVIVAAAGNESLNLDTYPRYPVCHDGVIGVASVNTGKIKSSFSNYGSTCVDASAPGEDIVSTVSTASESIYDSPYVAGWQGTSFSSPHVAGVAALIKSKFPAVTGEQLEAMLVSSALESIDALNPSYSGKLGGLINAYEAVRSFVVPAVGEARILTFPISGGGPQLLGFKPDGKMYKMDMLGPADYRGGGSIATGDVNGDGTKEIIYGTGNSTASRVKIYSHQGEKLEDFLAYSSPQNGIRVASGDTDADGNDEIVAVREAGSTPEVRVFDADGNIQTRFFAYPASFTGGMTVAVADIDDDRRAEIIIGTGLGALPRVQIFSGSGEKQSEFFAYGLGFRGGINVTAGDVDGDGQTEIITAPFRFGGPHVRIFSSDGTPERDFFAYGEGFHGGVDLSLGDVDGDGVLDIITGAGPGGGPHVRMFDGATKKSIGSFFAYAGSFHGGIRVLGYKE